jgi:lipoyl synthase
VSTERSNLKPNWLKIKIPGGKNYRQLKSIVNEYRLHTVCQSARCPNMEDCWSRKTATIMILGDICTRSCRFCAVKTGRPGTVDNEEPRRVADAVKLMGLSHVVITSVDRDELKDGGASIWAETIKAIRQIVPDCTIEALIPDFQGKTEALQTVLDAAPDILGHNLETIPRLYRDVRPQANYQQSLQVLQSAHQQGLRSKTGLMAGLGESNEEIFKVMDDALAHGADIFTIGQYLQPTAAHLPVQRYVTPEEFADYRRYGLEIGFLFVESGPLVRSSYHADEQIISHPLKKAAQ